MGDVAQGDIFFIEYELGAPKIPVLLVACEASMFIYMHLFMDSFNRYKGARVMVKAVEIQSALEGVIQLWADAGHPLKILRFDRESAIAATPIVPWFKSKGAALVLTAAGQKLGLGEVIGRIVKNRCRSTVAGVQERFGYRYPVKWFPRLVGDTVCILNRTVRRGSDLSPSQKFFGPDLKLDVLRALRAAIGEILLFKRPKNGVSSPIGEPKAEWGIVVSRSYNGSGVLEAYLIESRSYGHRYKFARMIVPGFIMDLVRGLTEVGMPPDRDILPSAPLEPSEVPLTSIESEVSPPTNEDIADLPAFDELAPDGVALDAVLSVLSAQTTYRRALLTSPERAVPAMEAEIRSLFKDKSLGHPVMYADIPIDERKYILRNLDGYKEKYGPDGEWIKSKARIFADGSKQRPEFTAESSSPVARIESIYALAGIAAFRKWPFMRFDVVCGYPNATRPPRSPL